MKNSSKTLIKEISYPINNNLCNRINETILQKKQKSYSHKINGRWENQYLDMSHIPCVRKILNIACQEGKNIIDQSLVIPYKELGFSRNEFWFNLAKPGDCTGWHDHKEQAVLSGVFYLQVPKNSGDIFFREKRKESWFEWSIKSRIGKMILFDSNLEHSVPINNSNDIRISLAFNLYTLPVMLSNEEEYSPKKFYP